MSEIDKLSEFALAAMSNDSTGKSSEIAEKSSEKGVDINKFLK